MALLLYIARLTVAFPALMAGMVLLSDQQHIAAADRGFDEAEQDTLYVEEFLLCRDVAERRPIDVVESFSMDDERAWGFAEIYSTYRIHTVTFKWYHEDEEYFTFEAKVGRSPTWRTYSSVGLQPGSWRVELYNEYGEKLKEIRFHVAE